MSDFDFIPLKGDYMQDIGRSQIESLGKQEKVNHPSHYNKGTIEVIDYIEDIGMGEDFCAGNAIKYISRYKFKDNPVQDLKKAAWYINRLIERYEANKR